MDKEFFKGDKSSRKYARLGNATTKTIVVIAAAVLCLMYVTFIGVSALKTSSGDSTGGVVQAPVACRFPPLCTTTTTTTTVTSVSTSTVTSPSTVTSTTTSAVCCETTTTTLTQATGTVTSTVVQTPDISSADSSLEILFGDLDSSLQVFNGPTSLDCSVTITLSTSGMQSSDSVSIISNNSGGSQNFGNVVIQNSDGSYTGTLSTNTLSIGYDIPGSNTVTIYWAYTSICPSS